MVWKLAGATLILAGIVLVVISLALPSGDLLLDPAFHLGIETVVGGLVVFLLARISHALVTVSRGTQGQPHQPGESTRKETP